MLSQSSTVPAIVTRVAEIMSTYPAAWLLCGGWGVDAWLGRQTRDHGDFDITIFHDDQRAIFDHLNGWKLVGHDPNVRDDTKELWDGRILDLPAHIHADPGDGTKFEVILNARRDEEWVVSDSPRITLPLGACQQQSAWGVPTLAPEVILFYKATAEPATFTGKRPWDEADFITLLPHLEDGPRSWLRSAITVVNPQHPWLPHFSK